MIRIIVSSLSNLIHTSIPMSIVLMVYDTLRALRHLRLPHSTEGKLGRTQRPPRRSPLTSVMLQHKGEVWDDGSGQYCQEVDVMPMVGSSCLDTDRLTMPFTCELTPAFRLALTLSK